MTKHTLITAITLIVFGLMFSFSPAQQMKTDNIRFDIQPVPEKSRAPTEPTHPRIQPVSPRPVTRPSPSTPSIQPVPLKPVPRPEPTRPSIQPVPIRHNPEPIVKRPGVQPSPRIPNNPINISPIPVIPVNNPIINPHRPNPVIHPPLKRPLPVLRSRFYRFWIITNPCPWPDSIYITEPETYAYTNVNYYPYPDYYGFYNYNSYYYPYNYSYGNSYTYQDYNNEGNTSPETSNEDYNQTQSQNLEQLQKEYESWITQQLGLEGIQKTRFIANLRRLQYLRENYLEERQNLTDELGSLQSQNASEDILNKMIKQITDLDNQFQKEEKIALTNLMKPLTVEQKAKYYSLQKKFNSSMKQQSQQPID